MLDLSFGLPIVVRDAALKMVAPGPQSSVNREYYAQEHEKEIEDGRALDISGTPTLFINGRRIGQTIDWANLKMIIDSEIEYQKTAKNAGDDCGCEVKLDVPGMPSSTPAVAPLKKK